MARILFRSSRRTLSDQVAAATDASRVAGGEAEAAATRFEALSDAAGALTDRSVARLDEDAAAAVQARIETAWDEAHAEIRESLGAGDLAQERLSAMEADLADAEAVARDDARSLREVGDSVRADPRLARGMEVAAIEAESSRVFLGGLESDVEQERQLLEERLRSVICRTVEKRKEDIDI